MFSLIVAKMRAIFGTIATTLILHLHWSTCRIQIHRHIAIDSAHADREARRTAHYAVLAGTDQDHVLTETVGTVSEPEREGHAYEAASTTIVIYTSSICSRSWRPYILSLSFFLNILLGSIMYGNIVPQRLFDCMPMYNAACKYEMKRMKKPPDPFETPAAASRSIFSLLPKVL
mmetsp:Transcript_9253/g.26035  ORF Transcript_9253/g.26035 Transcript_9253/m.26035 type:complete len:174 (-) Transcript_9253:117-638(-)